MQDEVHREDVQNFMDDYGLKYNGVSVYGPSNTYNQWTARNKAMYVTLLISTMKPAMRDHPMGPQKVVLGLFHFQRLPGGGGPENYS